MPPDPALPDVLVLAGGGVRGEAWMSAVLAGFEAASGCDLRRVPFVVGTSAGSIVGARLAAGGRPRRPRESAPATPGVALAGVLEDRGGPVQGLFSPALPALAPAGALARAIALGRVPNGSRRLDELHERLSHSDASFDGRLRVACVERGRGRRVVFGAPGAPAAEVADAVVASCAIPGVFAPVEIGGREYVDGGVWSLTNLDVAPAGRGDRVLCLNPTAGERPGAPSGIRAWSRGRASVEAQSLRRRGAEVLHVAPDPASARAMGPDLMAPGDEGAVMAAGTAQGRALAGAWRGKRV